MSGKAKDPDYWSKYSKAHAEEKRASGRAYYARHRDEPAFKERIREASVASCRKRNYGLSRERYAEMVEEQHGECAICHEYHGDRLYVDHDHKTGQVRGLLCNACNVGLGRFNDDLPTLIRARDYLLNK